MLFDIDPEILAESDGVGGTLGPAFALKGGDGGPEAGILEGPEGGILGPPVSFSFGGDGAPEGGILNPPGVGAPDGAPDVGPEGAPEGNTLPPTTDGAVERSALPIGGGPRFIKGVDVPDTDSSGIDNDSPRLDIAGVAKPEGVDGAVERSALRIGGGPRFIKGVDVPDISGVGPPGV